MTRVGVMFGLVFAVIGILALGGLVITVWPRRKAKPDEHEEPLGVG